MEKIWIRYVRKKYKIRIVIHQLIDFLSPNFKISFKKKSIKGVFNFNSFYEWLLNFNKLKNRNILIYSFVESQNFYSFLVNFFIGRGSRPILKYIYPDVPELKSKISNKIIFNLKNKNFLFFNVIKFFFNKVSEILNIKYCDYLITSKKYYLNNKFIFKKKKIKISIGTALDYSNFLLSNKLKVKNI